MQRVELWRMLASAVLACLLSLSGSAVFAAPSVPVAGISELAYAVQPDGSLYVTGKHQGKPVNMVRSGAPGAGKWLLYTGPLNDRVRFSFDDRKGLQEILAMDKGQRILVNTVGQERIEYRFYTPDRRFLAGSVRFRQNGRWLQGLMRSEVFSGYSSLTDVSDVTDSQALSSGPSQRLWAWLQEHWQALAPIRSAHAGTADDLVKGFFSNSAQEARGFWGAPLDEMWKGALVGAGAFTVKLAGQMVAAGETGVAGTALVAAAPFLVAVGTGVVIGVAAEKTYDWAQAKNLSGSVSMRELYNKLVAGTRFSREAPPEVPAVVMPDLVWPQLSDKAPAPRAPAPVSAKTGAGPANLLELADKLDSLDRQDLSAALEKADQCTAQRDFACTSMQLDKAAKFVSGSGDRLALENSRQKMTHEKALLAEEERQRAEQARQAELARQREQARTAQAERDSGFQWGKAAALLAGASIGGLDKLGAEAQVKIVSGILQDSQAGQTGISNFQGSVNGLKPGAAGADAAAGGRSGGSGGVSKEAFNAGELACQQEADRNARPYKDSQLDTFCVLASSNACVKRKFNFDGYESQRRESCTRMKQTARALNLNPDLCGACQ